MLRDPVSALMSSVAASFMILSIPLNLLVGLSVLMDQPSIQSCNILFLYFAAIIVASQWYLITISIGLIATIQLLIIKCGRKRVSTRKVLLAFAVLMSFVMAFSIVQCVVGLWNETFTVVAGLIYTVTSDDATFLIGMVLGHGVPFVITSYMTYRTVKNGIVETDNDNNVTRSVLIMNVTTIVTILISKIVPLPALIYWATTTGSTIAHGILTLLLITTTFWTSNWCPQDFKVRCS